MDIISDILKTIRLNARIYHNAQYCGQWVMQGREINKASFHFVSHGECFLHIPNNTSPSPLNQGDLLLFPRHQEHWISSSEQPPQSASGEYFDYEQGVLAESAGLVCGLLELEHQSKNPLLEELPDVVIIRSAQYEYQWVMPLLRLINQELLENTPGHEAVLDKLADVLFIQVIRSYMHEHQLEAGLLAALQDEQLHKALQLMHAQLDKQWTVDSLAAAVGVSRSAFAERFKAVINQSPMNYLNNWRMQQAYRWLHDEQLSVLEVAERCGYQSDASFSKAFKKQFGFGPGAARRDHQLDHIL